MSSAVLQFYSLLSCEATNVVCEVFIFLCVVLSVPRNLSQTTTTYIPCLFCSLLRTCLILFVFTLQIPLSHKFKVELLFDSSRLWFWLSCLLVPFPFCPFFSNFLLPCYFFPLPSLPPVFNQKWWLS